MGAHVALDVAAGFGQQGFQHRPGRFLMVAVFGRGGGRTERLFEKGDADPFGAAHFLERGRRPCFALHHLGEQGQPDADDLAFLGQTGHGLFQELLLVLARFAAVFGKFAERPPKRRQHFSGVVRVEEINGGGVLSFDEANFQLPHEAGRRHPEVVPHHDDALHPAAVALPQGLHQFGVPLFLLGVEPLLELVEDDQHLLARRDALPSAQCGQRLLQPQLGGQGRTPLPQPVEEARLRLPAVAST